MPQPSNLSDYGYFLASEAEFVITTPLLPKPWANYLSNAEYCAVVTHTGGGYSFLKDPSAQRILSWDNSGSKLDRPGRYIYIRDQKTGEVISTTWQPFRKKPDHFACHVGLGYQRIESRYGELEQSVTYFVPPQDRCEIWYVTIQNNSNDTKDLSVFGYAEWLLGCVDESLMHHQAIMWNRAQYDEKSGGILARKTVNYEKQKISQDTTYCFFGLSARADGFDCNKDTFLGKFNGASHPEAIMLDGKCRNSYLIGDEAIGVLQTNFFLKPGEIKTIVFVLGAETSEDKAVKLMRKYKTPTHADEAFAATKLLWQQRIIEQPLQFQTPDDNLNLMLNQWAKVQTWMTHYWCRSAGLFSLGRNGQGYRDTCHDVESMLLLDPAAAHKKLLKISTLIRRDGTCAPGWSETFGIFSSKPIKDHAVWFTSAVHAYINETGKLDILKEKTTWLKDAWIKGGKEIDPQWKQGATTDGQGTLWEKIKMQLDFSYHNTAAHGLLRMGMADWNESLDAADDAHIGGSVWLSMAMVWALRMGMEMAEWLGDPDTVALYGTWIHTLTERINGFGWDGAWYLRGYNEDLEAFGSSKNVEGKLYLNTQSWAILAEVAPPERIGKILENVDRYLEVEKGYTLFYPAYTLFNKNLGQISMFSPGLKDNAGIMMHAQTMMLAANCKLDRSDVAYRILSKSLPSKQMDYTRYQSEPYAFAQFMIGPDHPYESGGARFSWMSATAGWTLMLLSYWICGIQPQLKGLHINPKIPTDWRQCKLTRPFRGDIYEFEILNPSGHYAGVTEVYLDEKRLDVPFINPVGDGKKHCVRVILG